MRVILGAFVATTMLAVVGCSTIAENPNYQQTTRYKGSNPYTDKAVVQQASYQRSVQTQAPAPVSYATQRMVYTSPQNNTASQARTVVRQSAPTYQQAPFQQVSTIQASSVSTAQLQTGPVQTGQSQTGQSQTGQSQTGQSQIGIQENTASFGDGGTPGYYAVNGIEPPAQATQTTPQQYAQIQTLNPQQIVPEPMPVPTGFTAVPAQPLSTQASSFQTGSMRHRVIVGDTLYSLARTTCSSVSEIQQMNTINSEFYIRVGEDIMVPNGRCVE